MKILIRKNGIRITYKLKKWVIKWRENGKWTFIIQRW